MESWVWCRGCGGESFLNGLDTSLSVGTINFIRALKVSTTSTLPYAIPPVPFPN